MVRVAMIQMQGAYDKAQNIEKAGRYIREAAARGARIICLQELFNTIYFCFEENPKYFEWAEPIPGPTTQAIGEVARREGVVVVAPIYEEDKGSRGTRYNSAAVIGTDGELVGIYRKNSIPLVDTPTTFGNEKYYFASGNLGFPVFPTPFGVKLGIVICYDRHFLEGVRSLALHGADLMLAPTATWGLFRPVWEAELQAHAVFNQFYVGGVNRVGYDEKGTRGKVVDRGGVEEPCGERKGFFFGSSIFVSPTGEVVGSASEEAEETIFLDLDLALIEKLRSEWALYRDRRPDTYRRLVE